ncbi:MAG: hypothetical protein HQL52_00045 [Magnetococcales bacterium]|nr:hypothetical protein [Magnetococcales bacterium]
MKKQLILAAAAVAFFGLTAAAQAECVVHYVRTACKGQEAISYKKCGGKQACDKVKPADTAEACKAKALKSCSNSRLDITKYKKITADFNGKALVGGFDATGNPKGDGLNFCSAKRPDLNQCD